MRTTLEVFARLAQQHAGYFTAAEATAAGISSRTLSHHASTGMLERPAHGIYRLSMHPPTPHGSLVIALLWAGPGSAISHESAMVLHGLRPSFHGRVHVTVPRTFRGRRPGVEVHCQPLNPEECVVIDALRVTSVDRTLADLSAPGTNAPDDEEASRGPVHDSTEHPRIERSVPPRAGAASRALPSSGDVRATDTFIGRHAELAELAAEVERSRLVTVTGPPGVGKSRLALELAGRAAFRYPDGTFLVELAAISDAALVPRAVADALSVWEQAGRPLADTIVDFVESQRILIVLDNCEHLVEGCNRLVERLVVSCPNLSILATSRECLLVRGEQVWPAHPLGVPAADADLATVSANEAVLLFCHRAEATRRGFRPQSADLAAVADICRRLDGLPLAIELAAARVGVLTPQDISDRLDYHLGVLADPTGERLSRHPTMTAAIEWSYSLLPAAEQVLLRRLSVFAGGCTPGAVETVCDVEGSGSAGSFLDSLSSLIDKSLVVADTSGPYARYRLLETVRTFGAMRADEADETEPLRAGHLGWLVALAEAAAEGLTGRDQLQWLERLDAEHDNLRAALSWAIRVRREEALWLTASLGLFWRLRGHLAEGARWIDAALAMGANAGHPAATTQALWGKSLLSLVAGDHSACSRAGSEALARARQAGDTRTEGRCLLVIGNSLMGSDRPAGVGLLEEAVAKARSSGDDWCLAHALGLIGRIRLSEGDPAAAQSFLDESLAVARQAGDHQSLRLALQILADLVLSKSHPDEAALLLAESLEIGRRLSEPYAMAAALCVLGEIANERGDLAQAELCLLEALDLGRRAAAPDCVAGALCSLASVALKRHDMEESRRRFQEAIAAGREARLDVSPALRGLAEIAIAEGDLMVARRMFDQVLCMARSSHNRATAAGALYRLGQIDRNQGDTEQATTEYLEALDLFSRLGDIGWVAASLEALAGAATDVKRFEYAGRLFGAAQKMRERQGLVRAPAFEAMTQPDRAAAAEGLGPERLKAALTLGAALSPSKAVAYANRGRGGARPPRGWASLTPTEREVAVGVTDGLTNAQIAERLFISPRTVGSHLSRIYAKLDITSRTQLVSHQAAHPAGIDTVDEDSSRP